MRVGCRGSLYHFNPRSPRGGATRCPSRSNSCRRYFNPRSPRGGATSVQGSSSVASFDFNPRSPRGGATSGVRPALNLSSDFNPRSPRGGATPAVGLVTDMALFQSTLPTRGSDTEIPFDWLLDVGISIHAPHEGERHAGAHAPNPRPRFQSTLPTRGSDGRPFEHGGQKPRFQSTLPTRGSDGAQA